MKTRQYFSKTLSAAMMATALFFGSSAAFAQVKIGTNPTTINSANNLEVEASTAGRKTTIDKTTGKVTIADGSQGVNYTLTSDAAGVATWTAPAATVEFSATLAGSTTIPTFAGTHDALAQRIALVPTLGGATWDAATKRWTIPSDGFYTIQVGLSCNSAPTGAGVVFRTRIWVVSENGGPLYSGTTKLGVSAGDWQSVVYSGQLSAGDAVSLEGYTMQTDGNQPVSSTWTGTCGRAYMTVQKTRN